MTETEGVDTWSDQVDEIVDALRRGIVDAAELEHTLIHLVDDALDERAEPELRPDDEAAFVDHVLAAAVELSNDPRVGRATLHDTIRAHLDRTVARPAATARLADRLAALRIGLTFDCDAQHLELIDLCREGRALDPLVHHDSDRALEVVGLAAEFRVISALHATVDSGEDAWKRLGQHHVVWVAAFDALASIAWDPTDRENGRARDALLDLLSQPHTALDAAVRIRPSWLAGDNIHHALEALDRVEAWAEAQPLATTGQDARFQAITHAVTSLVWLARDADRSFEVHQLWGGAGVLS